MSSKCFVFFKFYKLLILIRYHDSMGFLCYNSEIEYCTEGTYTYFLLFFIVF